MPYLGTLILGLALMAFGLVRRRRRKQVIDQAYVQKLALVSLGAGSAIVGGALPVLWLLVSYSLRGGTVEDNLPPGFDVKAILTVVVVGGVVATISAIYGYLDHLDS